MEIKKIFPFFSKKRKKIQVHILTVFLSLLALATLVITRFTYRHYRDQITELSHLIGDQANQIVSDKIEVIKNGIEFVAEVIKGSLMTHSNPLESSDYVGFLINLLKNEGFLNAIKITSSSGDVLSIKDDSSLQVPYWVQKIKYNDSFCEETIEKFDIEGNRLSKEAKQISCPKKNILTQEKRSIWIDNPLKQNSLSLSQSVSDSKGNLLFELEVQVTLEKLSNFLLKQKIGKRGSAFIINDTGDIETPLIASYSLKEEALKKGYEEYIKNKKPSFDLVVSGERYLFSISDAFIFPNSKWHTVVIVPFNDFFANIHKTQNLTRFVSFLVFLICGTLIYFSARRISKPIMELANQLDRIRNFDFAEPKSLSSKIKEIFDLEASVRSMRSALHSFGKYIPKDVVKGLIRCGKDVELGGERAEITILFSDIKNFTTISESLPIEDLTNLLADYFDLISRIVLSNEGTIDKYIGDSLMAFWGAPIKITGHVSKACLACLQCLAAIKDQKKWVTRFGVHTGEVVVGNIGTSERMNYTVIGDAVNIASRLESINKEYGTSIMISEVVQQKIGPRFITRPIDFVAVKGKQTKIKIFELMGMKDGALAAEDAQISLSEKFTFAYRLFEEGKMQEAYTHFLELEKMYPSDIPIKKYIALSQSHLT